MSNIFQSQMLFKIKFFTGFDKSQSYGLFSIYLNNTNPERWNYITRLHTSTRIEDITGF